MRLILSLITLLFFACDNGGGIDSLGTVVSIDHGVGTPCGGSVMNYNGLIYRTYTDAGGVALLNQENLNFVMDEKLGNYNVDGNYVYHSEIINDNLWLSVVNDNSDNHSVKVLDFLGNEIESYDVGVYPGDFASWDNAYVFVSNEGGMDSSNGSISVISKDGAVASIDNIGDVVNAVEVYNDKLVVLVNGGTSSDSKLVTFNITDSGLSLPGIEIDLSNSSPREMVIVNQRVYFTNWNTQDIKVFNLFTYEFEGSVFMPAGIPEDIITDGDNLYVAIPSLEKWDTNLGTNVVKVDINSLSIKQTYDVGFGPESLTFSDSGDLYIVRRTYSDDWYTTYHGTSKIIAP